MTPDPPSTPAQPTADGHPERVERLDKVLVSRGLARSRASATQLVADGLVLVDGQPADRPSRPVRAEESVELTVSDTIYVSRAAGKLIGALDDLRLRPSGRALDAGASTGGFTQVLLERGCDHVVAVDVGHEQISPVLRNDPRVTVREGLHLRDLTMAAVGAPVDWVTADVSFVSLVKIIDPMLAVTDPGGSLLLMVKPQFEVGRKLLRKGGVVRDPQLHTLAVRGVLDHLTARQWWCHGATRSRLPGPAGNIEFFVHLRRDRCAEPVDSTGLVDLDLGS